MFQKLIKNPKLVFLCDSLGALLSAFLIGILLTNFQQYIGLPKERLYMLAAIAGVLCMYSGSCFLFIKTKWKPFLLVIITANSLYTVLTIAIMILYAQEITGWGILYFVSEIFVLATVIRLEIKSFKFEFSN